MSQVSSQQSRLLFPRISAAPRKEALADLGREAGQGDANKAPKPQARDCILPLVRLGSGVRASLGLVSLGLRVDKASASKMR